LCEHVTNVTYKTQDDLNNNRNDLLVIMSFCLLGEMTFIAANTDEILGHWCLIVPLILSLSFWAVAFAIGLFMLIKGKTFVIIPGYYESLTFLPCEKDRAAFKKSKKDPYEADEFFCKEYLKKNEIKLPVDPDYNEVIQAYNESILSLTDLDDFNKNAWLASLTHSAWASRAILKRVKPLIYAMYILFLLNIAFLVLLIVLCVISPCPICEVLQCYSIEKFPLDLVMPKLSFML
jgi:hypothetical protein